MRELPLEEQLELIALLVRNARMTYQHPGPPRKWSEVAGAAPYGLFGGGEDAQMVISRERRESTEHREAIIGPRREEIPTDVESRYESDDQPLVASEV